MRSQRPPDSEFMLPRLPATLLAMAIVSLAAPAAATAAAAAEGSVLQLFHGPDDTGSMKLKALRFNLDGKDLGVKAPSPDADPAVAIFTGSVAAGIHKLEVEVILEAKPSLFTYTDGYRIKIRNLVELEVLPGEGAALRSRIVPRSGMTVPWQERNRLALTLTSANVRPQPTADVAAAPAAAGPATEAAPASPVEAAPIAAAAPAPEPSPSVAVAAAAAPAAPVATRPAPVSAAAREPAPMRPTKASGPCAPDPIRFEFDKASLTAAAREALDRIATCLAATSVRVRVDGYCDPRGGDQYNRWLSWDRAAAVSAYLQERGVAARRLSTRFQVKPGPACPETSEPCFAEQRRVEVVPLE